MAEDRSWSVVHDGLSLGMIAAPDGRIFRLQELGKGRGMWGNAEDNDQLCEQIAAACTLSESTAIRERTPAEIGADIKAALERDDKPDQHTPGGTDLRAIAERIKECREDASSDAVAFGVLLYRHESIDVEAALRVGSAVRPTMSRQDAITLFCEIATRRTLHGFNMTEERRVVITEFANACIARHVPSATASVWISVEERLPPACGYVLATKRLSRHVCDYYVGTHPRECAEDISHWMPLPIAPTDSPKGNQ